MEKVYFSPLVWGDYLTCDSFSHVQCCVDWNTNIHFVFASFSCSVHLQQLSCSFSLLLTHLTYPCIWHSGIYTFLTFHTIIEHWLHTTLLWCASLFVILSAAGDNLYVIIIVTWIKCTYLYSDSALFRACSAQFSSLSKDFCISSFLVSRIL